MSLFRSKKLHIDYWPTGQVGLMLGWEIHRKTVYIKVGLPFVELIFGIAHSGNEWL